jgi:hypothetical protein
MADQTKKTKSHPEVAVETNAALATPRVNIIPATAKNLFPRVNIQDAIRLGAARHRETV